MASDAQVPGAKPKMFHLWPHASYSGNVHEEGTATTLLSRSPPRKCKTPESLEDLSGPRSIRLLSSMVIGL